MLFKATMVVAASHWQGTAANFAGKVCRGCRGSRRTQFSGSDRPLKLGPYSRALIRSSTAGLSSDAMPVHGSLLSAEWASKAKHEDIRFRDPVCRPPARPRERH